MSDVNTSIEGKLDVSYLGYTGDYAYETEEVGDPFYHGKVLGIADVITYEANTIALLNAEFKQSINDYIDFCKELNKVPLKPLTYNELLNEFNPTIVTNEEGLDKIQVVVHKLIDRGRLTTEEDQYLSLLLLIVRSYESVYYSTPKYDDYLFEYSVITDSSKLIRIAAESFNDAINLFFQHVTPMFCNGYSYPHNLTIIRVIHLDNVKCAALKKLDNT